MTASKKTFFKRSLRIPFEDKHWWKLVQEPKAGKEMWAILIFTNQFFDNSWSRRSELRKEGAGDRWTYPRRGLKEVEERSPEFDVELDQQKDEEETQEKKLTIASNTNENATEDERDSIGPDEGTFDPAEEPETDAFAGKANKKKKSTVFNSNQQSPKGQSKRPKNFGKNGRSTQSKDLRESKTSAKSIKNILRESPQEHEAKE